LTEFYTRLYRAGSLCGIDRLYGIDRQYTFTAKIRITYS
jgi:hypothetical protein